MDKIELCDARNLNFKNEQFDLVLLLGPLYHLTERKERVNALTEARRVLKPGGVVLAAIISRYASLFDGFQRDFVFDDQFFKILATDLETGVHFNDTNNFEYFTTAYFHTAKEIVEEIVESGLAIERLVAIESFGWIIKDFSEKANDEVYMKKLLAIIRRVETNEDLLAMSPHIMAVAHKNFQGSTG